MDSFREKQGKSFKVPIEIRQRVLSLIDIGVSVPTLSKQCNLSSSAIYHWRRCDRNSPILKNQTPKKVNSRPLVKAFDVVDYPEIDTKPNSSLLLRGAFGRFKFELNF